jgi:uncharacterized protein (TIGR02117 family)
VAAPPLGLVGRAARAILGWLALLLGAYFLAGWIGSSIPRNADWRETPGGVEIMVETNGVHTAIVMPLVTAQKDWRQDFPASDIAAPDRPYSHVAVSWGEREVFLNTPTWSDLSPLTALRIVTNGGEGLLHVAHYVRPAPDQTIRPLRIGEADYARLVRRIETRMAKREGRRRYPGYGRDDVFYDAPGVYTPINTCNQWTGDVLAGAGIRTGWWTPFAGSVMKWVPPVEGAGS